jgi:hypothetical protein
VYLDIANSHAQTFDFILSEGLILLKYKTVFSAPQLIYGAKLDYIVFDYLSEITMSLLTAGMHKNPVSNVLFVYFFTLYFLCLIHV